MCTCRNTKCICQTPHLISLKCIPNEHEAIPREFNLHKLNEMSKEVRLPAHRLVSELSHSIELFLHLAAFSALTPMAKTGRHSSLTNSHAICVQIFTWKHILGKSTPYQANISRRQCKAIGGKISQHFMSLGCYSVSLGCWTNFFSPVRMTAQEPTPLCGALWES